MNTPATLQSFETILAPYTERFNWRDDYRLDAYIAPAHLLEVIQTLHQHEWRYLAAMTGLDIPPVAATESTPEAEGQIEVLYQFCEGPCILTLRVTVPYSQPVIPSVCGLIPPATLYEREMIEMFGVEITNTPSTARLLLPDDWPDGVYPLRKSFKGL